MRFKPATVVALGVYSVVGGILLAGIIAAVSLAAPLALQIQKTPDYASGYQFFVVVVCVLACIYGLLAGFAQFVAVSIVAFLSKKASMRARTIATLVTSGAVAVGASLTATQVFGYEAVPLWLVPIVAALDVVGLVLAVRIAERYKEDPSRT